MELNEFFKSYSLETINQKTNIPLEVLEKIKNKEWEKLKRVQTIGFLKIIEREFGIDLSEAKEECNDFFKHQKQKEPISPIDLVDAEVTSGSSNKIISFILTIITLAALIYAGWFYYTKQKNKNEFENISPTSNNTTIEKKEEKKEIIEQKEKISIKEKKENSYKKFDITSNNTTIEQQKEKNKSLIDNNAKKEVEFLLNETKENPSSKQQSIIEQNNTQNNTTKFDFDPLSSNSNDNLNDYNLKADELLSLNKDINNSSKELNSSKIVINKATISPNTKKLWIGVYNLETGKKISKIVKKSFNLDLTKGNLVIVTGHGKFNLIVNNETKKFKKLKKQYILISKEEGIKLLTKKEYKELTKKRAW